MLIAGPILAALLTQAYAGSKATRFPPIRVVPSEKALLHVYRMDTHPYRIKIGLDGHPEPDLAADRFATFVIEPGIHKVKATIGMNLLMTGSTFGRDNISIDAMGGAEYFVRVVIHAAVKKRGSLSLSLVEPQLGAVEASRCLSIPGPSTPDSVEHGNQH